MQQMPGRDAYLDGLLGSATLAIKLLIFVSSSVVFATLSNSGLPLLFSDCL